MWLPSINFSLKSYDVEGKYHHFAFYEYSSLILKFNNDTICHVIFCNGILWVVGFVPNILPSQVLVVFSPISSFVFLLSLAPLLFLFHFYMKQIQSVFCIGCCSQAFCCKCYHVTFFRDFEPPIPPF